VNGKITLTVDDGEGTQTISLEQPYNDNTWRRVQVTRTTGMFRLMDDASDMVELSASGQEFGILSPIFVGGAPDTPPFTIIHDQVLSNAHFVGCVRRVQLSDGTTVTANVNATNYSNDVMPNTCNLTCNAMDCDPGPGNGECIEYYTHGVCDCRGVFDSEGEQCTGKSRMIVLECNEAMSCFVARSSDYHFIGWELLQMLHCTTV